MCVGNVSPDLRKPTSKPWCGGDVVDANCRCVCVLLDHVTSTAFPLFMSRLQLAFIPSFSCAHFFFFLTTKPLLPLHPKFPGRRHVDRPSIVRRCHKRAPPRKAHRSTLHAPHTAPRKSGLGLDHVSGGKPSYCVQARSVLFSYVPLYSFRLSFPLALHFYYFPFYVSPLPSNVAAPPSPSSTRRPLSRHLNTTQ